MNKLINYSWHISNFPRSKGVLILCNPIHAKISSLFSQVVFFRQFVASVTKVDYLTMRHGFINAHLAPNGKFDFHKYIKRSMEDDFKVVVGISIPLWTCCIISLLLNVYGWYTLTWISFMPLATLLLVGTKLEVIIMEMAQQIQDRTTVVKGAPVVEPSNKYFWFNQPDWILFLIHLTLFQNAFQMAYFLWIWYEFGLTSCLHEKLPEILIRVFLGVALQVLCSYITFPLYSLVTQMGGSHMKKAIFEEQTAKAVKKWQKAARERKKLRKAGATDVSSSGFMRGENTPSHNSSPIHLLHKYKINSNDIESVLSSPTAYHSENELSEIEGPARPSSNDDHETRRVETHHTDFSFVTP
ncbi:MLO protein homolog 1-like [Quercus robur]|uniref:MLO protein homolog 1-like n=1 Tax=Quercus robur TaxID=38942 RepID=UPI002163DA2B|nr:MLO protein homolog 1-like [Quercus robur]